MTIPASPTAAEVAPLSRELVVVADTAAHIVWADARAGALIGARPGRTLLDLCLPGTASKAAELVRRGSHEPLRGWELTILADEKPATVSFSSSPWYGNVLLVGQLL